MSGLSFAPDGDDDTYVAYFALEESSGIVQCGPCTYVYVPYRTERPFSQLLSFVFDLTNLWLIFSFIPWNLIIFSPITNIKNSAKIFDCRKLYLAFQLSVFECFDSSIPASTVGRQGIREIQFCRRRNKLCWMWVWCVCLCAGATQNWRAENGILVTTVGHATTILFEPT